MKQDLQLRQSQSIKLTPQLQMAIKLLQYSRLELDQEIERAIESNPFLELVDPQNALEPLSAESADASQPHTLAEFTETVLDNARQPQAEDDNPFEHIPQSGSLSSHLMEQLRLSHLTARDFAIGEALIDSLNEDGYCLCTWQDIRQACQASPEVEDQEIEVVLHLIQQFDPIGVAARTLPECLRLQLRQLDCEESLLAIAQTIASQHLDCLAKHGIAGVLKNCAYRADDVAQAVGILKTLDPKPGAAFNARMVEYIEPDYWLEKVRGNWKIHALKQNSLRINSFYQGLIAQSRGHDSVYMKQNLQEANWLIKSLQSRQETLKRVVKAIVNKQHAFLEQGPKALQALTMKEIAEQIGMHESTVSRACSNKYLRTDYGTFELRALFSARLAADSGAPQAASAAHAWIREFVAQENPAKPLSDSHLANALKQKGITAARRTIAKYRESLNIPPSYLRQKNL